MKILLCPFLLDSIDWEKFIEISLPEKEDFYSHLNKGDITDTDCTQSKRVCKDFKQKNLVNPMYVQSNSLLLADVFNNFWNMCLEVYGLDPAQNLSAPGLAWQTTLKRRKSN